MVPFEDFVRILRRLDRTLYLIAAESEMADPKCPYCDERRMITLSAPNGQSTTVPCLCGLHKRKVYYVIPCQAVSLKFNETALELQYVFGTRTYVRRHDSVIDPTASDKRVKSTNYIGLSFTTPEKAKAYIESQGWEYSEELTREAMEKAERALKAEIKEKVRPVIPDEKLRRKYAGTGVIIEGTFEGTDPEPVQDENRSDTEEPSVCEQEEPSEGQEDFSEEKQEGQVGRPMEEHVPEFQEKETVSTGA